MDRLLQQFEKPVIDGDGELYDVYLYGRSQPRDTWQAWLVFERAGDRTRFATGVETTQPHAEAVLYWATGLTDAYFEGALERALRPSRDAGLTLVGKETDSESLAARLAEIQVSILSYFQRQSLDRVSTQRLLDALPYAKADTIRAIEDLTRRGHVLERRTDQGNDWLSLTEDGIRITRRASRHDERLGPPR